MLRNCIVVVGCVFVGFVASAGPGLVASAAEPARWLENTGAPADESTPSSDESESDGAARLAQVAEQQTDRVAEPRSAAPAISTPQPAPVELDAMLARNEELMARNRALAAENQALAHSHLFEPSVANGACEPPPDDADPKAQLRYWAERLRDSDGAFRARLTPEQNAAVNVLVRRERELDPHNPWREPATATGPSTR
jgi:hypothetical protein